MGIVVSGTDVEAQKCEPISTLFEGQKISDCSKLLPFHSDQESESWNLLSISFHIIVYLYIKQKCHLDLDQRVLFSQSYCKQVWLIFRPCISGIEK